MQRALFDLVAIGLLTLPWNFCMRVKRKEYIFVKLKKMFSLYLMVIKLYKGVMFHAPYPLQRYAVYGYI